MTASRVKGRQNKSELGHQKSIITDRPKRPVVGAWYDNFFDSFTGSSVFYYANCGGTCDGSNLQSITGWPNCDSGSGCTLESTAFSGTDTDAALAVGDMHYCYFDLSYGGDSSQKIISIYKCLNYPTTNPHLCDVNRFSLVTNSDGTDYVVAPEEVYISDEFNQYDIRFTVPSVMTDSGPYIVIAEYAGMGSSERCTVPIVIMPSYTGSTIDTVFGYPNPSNYLAPSQAQFDSHTDSWSVAPGDTSTIHQLSPITSGFYDGGYEFFSSAYLFFFGSETKTIKYVRCLDFDSCYNDGTQPVGLDLTASVYAVYIDETDNLYQYSALMPGLWSFFSSDSASSVNTVSGYDFYHNSGTPISAYDFFKTDGEYKLVADANGEDRDWDTSTLPNGAFQYWTCTGSSISSYTYSFTFYIPDPSGAGTSYETVYTSASDYSDLTTMNSGSPYDACDVTYDVYVDSGHSSSDSSYYADQSGSGAINPSTGFFDVYNLEDLPERTISFILTATYTGGSNNPSQSWTSSVQFSCDSYSTTLDHTADSSIDYDFDGETYFAAGSTWSNSASEFTSSSTVCGLTSITMTSGSSHFTFSPDSSSTTTMGYTISLDGDYSYTAGLYQYTLEATAEGGATTTYTESVYVRRTCTATAVTSPDTDYTTSNSAITPTNFYIPTSGSAGPYVLFGQSDYATLLGTAAGLPEPCSYAYAIALDSSGSYSSSIGSEITIDSTGDVSLSPQSTQLYDSSDTFTIQITPSFPGDMTYATVSAAETISGFSTETVCGPDSATVEIDLNYERNSVSNTDGSYYADNFRAGGFSNPTNVFSFTNDNSVCPLSLSLDTGSSEFSVSFDSGTTSTSLSGTFTVTLDSTPYGTDGSYPYYVTLSTTEATSSSDTGYDFMGGTFYVADACTITLDNTFTDTSKTYYVPATGTNSEAAWLTGTDYVATDTPQDDSLNSDSGNDYLEGTGASCTLSYAFYESTDSTKASPNSGVSGLSIDSSTGVLSYTTSYGPLESHSFFISISYTDGVNTDEQDVTGMSIDTVCGANSGGSSWTTDSISPLNNEAGYPGSYFDTDSYTFTSGDYPELTIVILTENAYCPIDTAELASGTFDNDDFETLSSDFTAADFTSTPTDPSIVVRLKSPSNGPNHYSFQLTVKLTGADGTATGTKDITNVILAKTCSFDVASGYDTGESNEDSSDIYAVQESGTRTETVWMAASSYFDTSDSACSIGSIALGNGALTDGIFTISSPDGQLDATIGDAPGSQSFSIDATPSGGYPVDSTHNIVSTFPVSSGSARVLMKCGSGSTIITSPTIAGSDTSIVQESEDNIASSGGHYSYTNTFTSSNLNCPLSFSVDDTTNFAVSGGTPTGTSYPYTVTMVSDSAKTKGTYDYYVEAEASTISSESETDTSATITIEITRYCLLTDQSHSMLSQAFDEEIPASSTSTDTLISSATQYVSAPYADDGYNGACGYTFAVTQSGGNGDEVAVDTDGVVTLVNSASYLISPAATFSIEVTSTGATAGNDGSGSPYGNVVTVTGFSVVTSCGASSTVVQVTSGSRTTEYARSEDGSSGYTGTPSGSTCDYDSSYTDCYQSMTFESTNTVCPITDIVQATAHSYITITYDSANSYTVAMDAAEAQTMGTYSYSVTASASGAASGFGTQTIEITMDCQTSAASSFDSSTDSSYSYDIPNVGESDIAEIVFADYSTYASAPSSGCSQGFQIQQLDTLGGSVGNYPKLFVHANTGELTLTITSSSEDSYNFKIKITNSGGSTGTNPYTGYEWSPDFETSTLDIATVCGPASTTVLFFLDASSSVLKQIPNYSTPPQVAATATSQNSVCEIQGSVITAGSSYFEAISITQSGPSQEFVLNVLDTDDNSDNTDIDVTVESTAKGGASDTFSEQINIAETCTSTLVSDFVKDSFSTYLPNPDDTQVAYVFPTGSAEYVGVPAYDQDYLPDDTSCYQQFSLSGSDLSELTIDQTSGRVTLDNDHTPKTTYTFDIIVTTFDGTSASQSSLFNYYDQSVTNMQVTKECGPNSATVTHPTVDNVYTASEDYISSATQWEYSGSFTSNNALCDFSLVQIEGGADYFTLEETSGTPGDWSAGYTVKLDTPYTYTMGIYSYSLRGTAEGGAYHVTSSRSVQITRDCAVSDTIALLDMSKIQYIPLTGMDTHYVYEASDYSSTPYADDGYNGACFASYYFLDDNGDNVNTFGQVLSINVGTGQVTSYVFANELTSSSYTLKVTNQGGTTSPTAHPDTGHEYMPDITITGLVYETVCGPDSTIVTASLDMSNIYTIVPNYHTPLTITGTASSQNPTCVIEPAEWDAGSSEFETSIQTVTSSSSDDTHDVTWEVSLTTAAKNTEQTINFIIVINADGYSYDTTDSGTGHEKLSETIDIRHACTATLDVVYSFSYTADGPYILPYTWDSSEISYFPSDHYEYISDWEYNTGTDSTYLRSDVDCYQFFSYQMNSANALGSTTTDELTMDADTGILTFENRNELTTDSNSGLPHAKTTYRIDILIVTTDGYNTAGGPSSYSDTSDFLNPQYMSVDDVQFEKQCGPNSAVVTHSSDSTTGGAMHDFKSEDTIANGAFTAQYYFYSDRSHCPVDTLNLDSSSTDYSLTSTSYGSAPDAQFEVTMASPQTYTMGTYDYLMEAYAEGGAYDSFGQDIRITRDCFTYETSHTSIKLYDIPDCTSASDCTNYDDETLYYNQDYFTAPMSDAYNGVCTQTFSYADANGNSLTDLSIDSDTGQIDYVNRASRSDYANPLQQTKVPASDMSYTVTVVNTGGTYNTIGTSDGYYDQWQADLEVSDFTVQIQCGPASTTITYQGNGVMTHPQHQWNSADGQEDQYVYIDKADFSVTNGWCEIVSNDVIYSSSGSCVSHSDWTDNWGDQCDWYAGGHSACSWTTDASNGLYAYEACCECGGGTQVQAVQGTNSQINIQVEDASSVQMMLSNTLATPSNSVQGSAETEGAGLYTYYMLVTHAGTGSNILSGSYLIYHYCYAIQLNDPVDHWIFFVPESGVRTDYFPDSYLEYIDEALIGCGYEFTLVYRTEYEISGSTALSVGQYSGTFSFETYSFEKHTFDDIRVTIKNTGSQSTKSTGWDTYESSDDTYQYNTAYSSYTEFEYHTYLYLITKCGPLSTTVTASLDGDNDYTSSPNYTPEDLSGSYSVTNPACDVIDGDVTTGRDLWAFANWDSDADSFEIQMLNAPESTGNYDFEVELIAEGGAFDTVSNTLGVDEACLADIDSSFTKTYSWYVPESGSETEMFPSASTDYVAQPVTSSEYLPAGVSCSQTFSYEMSYADEAKPAELTMDPSTGRFTFSNKASILADYYVNIVIETSDGQNVDTDRVMGVHISTSCGSDSTTITTDAVGGVYASEDYQSSQVAETFSITSSNPVCAVTTVTVSDHVNTDEDGFFTGVYTPGASTYVVQLGAAESRTIGTYTLSVTAQATGGQYMSPVIKTWEITKTCTTTQLPEVRSVDMELQASIPSSGTSSVTVVSNIYAYVNSQTTDVYNPENECESAFSLPEPDSGNFVSNIFNNIFTGNDQPVTEGFAINTETGEVTLSLSSTSIGTYEFSFTVTTSGGSSGSQEVTIGPFTVTTVCGPTSTTITVPESATIPQHNSANGKADESITLTISKSLFVSSNPSCPLEDYSLAASTDDGITSNQDGDNVMIMLSRDSTDTAHVGAKSYDLVATAEGGAQGIFTSTFKIYHYCYATANEVALKSQTFDIPATDHINSFVADASTYFDVPLEGCSHEYSVEVTGASSAQGNMIVNSVSGIITLENYAEETISYTYSVKVKNTGSLTALDEDWEAYVPSDGTYSLNSAGVSTSTLEITGFSVSTQCGEASTSVTIQATPTKANGKQIPNYDPAPTVTGTVSSSNPTCPVTSYTLTTGSALYTMTEEDSTSFVLTMNAETNALEGTHAYTLQAAATGGAAATASGSYELQVACTASLKQVFETEYTFELPESGTNPQTFPSASTAYISAPTTDADYLPSGISCSQTYSYVMSYSLDARPDELTIDSTTGVFTLLNEASIKTSYTVDLIITTTDGYNPVTHTVAGITINKVCGVQSTTLYAPTLGTLSQIPNYPVALSVSNSFTSTNPACPVTAHKLLSNSNQFTMTDNGDEFEVTMTDNANKVDTEYAYMLRAVAEGGAYAFATGKMKLENVCTASLIAGFRSSYSYTVPASGTEEVTFPFTSAYYITEPIASSSALPAGVSCYQTFSYAVLTDHSPNVFAAVWRFITGDAAAEHNPETLVIDAATGVFTLTNPASATQSYEVEITVVTTDGYNAETLVVPGVTVETACGLTSTTIVPPGETEFAKAPNTLPVLSETLTATSSNPTCPITSSTLHSGHSEYLFEDNGDDIVLTMKPESNEQEHAYPYIIDIRAEGGAYKYLEGRMTVAKTCTASLVSGFPTEYTYDIPESGQQQFFLPFFSTDYVTQPNFDIGCTQTFAYEFANTDLAGQLYGDDAVISPDLVIGDTDGMLYLRNAADIKMTYEIKLIITTSDGTNDQVLTVPSVKIHTVCGPGSTKLTAPELHPQYKVPRTLPVLSIEGEFATSNPSCPVASYALTSGADQFDLTYTGAGFTVAMEADDNDVSAEYAYEVLATAEGGATASIEGYKFIETVCVSDLVSSFSKSFSFDLPTAGVTLEQFPSAATEYATAPPSSSDYLPDGVECSQSYSYRLRGESGAQNNPDDLEIDPATGVFTLVNRAEVKTTYEVEIDVVTGDGTNSHTLTVTGVTIEIVCGPGSTILTAPTLETVLQVPNLPVRPSLSGAFTSSNARCPVVAHSFIYQATDSIEQTEGEVGDFDLTDYGTTFEVTLSESANAVEQVHTFQLQASTDGGVEAIFEGSFEIAKVCLATVDSAFLTSYSYEIPEYGTQYEMFPTASSDYISLPPTSSPYLPSGYSCYQEFSYRLHTQEVDSIPDPNPSELTIDSSTGVLTLSNQASTKQAYLIDIDVKTTDGVNDVHQVVTEVSVGSVCGIGSTTVTGMSPPTVEKAPRTVPTLTAEASFSSSNPSCPIESVSVHSAHDSFTVAMTSDSYGGADYTVTMTEQAASVDDETYTYTVTAQAEGSTTATVAGTMSIDTPVGSTLLTLTGFPDCEGSCQFHSGVSSFTETAEAVDDQPGGTTVCSNDLNFGGLAAKTLQLFKCDHLTYDADHCEYSDSSPVTGWSITHATILEDSDQYVFSYVASLPDLDDYSYMFVASYEADGVTYTDRCTTIRQLKVILDGTNLEEETNWPDCTGDCHYYTDYDLFLDGKATVDDTQGGSTYGAFEISDIDWSSIAIGYFRADCTLTPDANQVYELETVCSWDFSDYHGDWQLSRVYFVRDGDWGFSKYEFTVDIPFFPRGGDFVIVAYDPSDTSKFVVYEEMLTFVDQYYGYNLDDTSGWPDCDLTYGCRYYVRDMAGFLDYADAATHLPYDNCRNASYTVAQFSTDISGWSDAQIGVFKASCNGKSKASKCSYSLSDLQSDWYIDAVHIEHTDDALTYHFTVRFAEFALGGEYVIAAYQADFDNYEPYPDVLTLEDLGLYGITFGDVGNVAYCSVDDGCAYYSNTDVVNSPYAFDLMEKQYATSYVGEAIRATFSVADAEGVFDGRFDYRYVIVPGVCSNDDLDDCSWNDEVQMVWTPSDMFYNIDSQTYEWLMFLPDGVAPGEHYLLSVYSYDHWNLDVAEAMAGIIISIKEHPTPDGDNLLDMFGAPNCDDEDCTFYSNYLDFIALTADQQEAKRGTYLHFSTNLFDNLWTQYAFAVYPAACDDSSILSTCSLTATDALDWPVEAVAISDGDDTEYYEGLVYIPMLDQVHGDYVIVRYNPTLSDSTEIIQAVTLVQVGGLANIAPGEGGGNSPTEERTSTDDFFDDIGENCFAIVQDHVGIDFRDPPRDIDPLLRGQNDYIFMQLELTDTTIDFGWQCRDPNYCPVTELSRLHLDHRQKALMLKIDWDAVQYIENGEFLQIMLAEVEDSSVVPLQADSGIFISVEIAAIIPATCPVLDSGGFVFNTEGGGGVRDGIATSDYNEYISALADECEDLAVPLPANYRTISFDDEYSDLEEQSAIRGDYVSFGFTYTSNSDLEVGWQCESLNNCPVAEVAKYYPGNAGTAIYIFKIDQGLAVGATFTMEFALVEDPDALPLVALDSISVPFIGASGEPTCGLDDTLQADTMVGDNYFADYFDVYVPDASSDTEGRRSIVTMVVEIAVVAAIAAVTALFYGGIL